MLASVSLACVGVVLLHAVTATPSSPIAYRTYAEITKYLLELNATFPDVVQVSVAQDTYGLPYPEDLQCITNDVTNDTEPCKQFVVHLTNHSTLENDPERPEVFISGALHGNERIGPNAAIELVALFAYATSTYGTANTTKPLPSTQRWLKELVNARNVLVMPMTNAYGYSHNHREELTVDPNRDYNYMRSGTECMQAMTSRVVNEIWRDHIFQLAVTFHAGTQAVAYEWGSPDHYLDGNEENLSEKSPDDVAQIQLTNTLANFAGVFSDGQLYPTGTMNDIVYGVTGGMEDWGYAASWENQFYDLEAQPFQPCEPSTFGGYPKEKTIYNNITHRAFNILVETSNSKEPEVAELGDLKELYNANIDFFRTEGATTEFVGHVPRNVRLALMMIEMAQPMIRWVDAARPSQSSETGDGFPTTSLYTAKADQVNEMGCGASAWKRNEVATCSGLYCKVETSSFSKVQVAWEVLGALTVDSTYVQVSSNKSFDHEVILLETTEETGTTRRFYDFAANASQAAYANVDTMGTSLFVTCLDLGNVTSETLYVRAVATVDQVWKIQGTGDSAPSPRVPPQSHLVNARTNPDWDFEWNGHRVKAALEWTSPVITVEMSKSSNVGDNLPGNSAGRGASPIVSNSSTERRNSRIDATTDPLVGSKDLNDEIDEESQDSENDDDDESDEEAITKASHSATTTKSVAAETNDDDEIDDDDSEDSSSDEDTDDSSLNDTIKGSKNKESNAHQSFTNVTHNTTALASNGSKLADKPASGLLRFGYIIMSSCLMIIVLTMAYLYRRVFRRSRQPYMNIEHGTGSVLHRTEEDLFDMQDDESDEEAGPRIPRHAQTARCIL